MVPEVNVAPSGEYADPTDILLPRIVTLQLVGLPLLVAALLLAVAAVFVVGAVRRIRHSRSR